MQPYHYNTQAVQDKISSMYGSAPFAPINVPDIPAIQPSTTQPTQEAQIEQSPQAAQAPSIFDRKYKDEMDFVMTLRKEGFLNQDGTFIKKPPEGHEEEWKPGDWYVTDAEAIITPEGKKLSAAEKKAALEARKNFFDEVNEYLSMSPESREELYPPEELKDKITTKQWRFYRKALSDPKASKYDKEIAASFFRPEETDQWKKDKQLQGQLLEKYKNQLDAINTLRSFLKGGDYITGFTGMALSNLPATDAAKARELVNQIKGNDAINLLTEMKNQTRTGASGFGSLSGPELNLLLNSNTTLNPDNSHKVFVDDLNKLEKNILRYYNTVNAKYGLTSPYKRRRERLRKQKEEAERQARSTSTMGSTSDDDEWEDI